MPSQDAVYLSEFSLVFLFILAGILFVMAAFITSRLVRPNRPNAQKLASYESGEEPVTSPWTQFNVRFYIIALVFLLFEVEIIFLFPWATVFANPEWIAETKGDWGWFSLLEMVLFIAILALGLAYAWVNGHLDWIKPDPRPTEFQSHVPKSLYDKVNEQYKTKKP
jgi:NADH-quinone oxidoreductase subunit A